MLGSAPPAPQPAPGLRTPAWSPGGGWLVAQQRVPGRFGFFREGRHLAGPRHELFIETASLRPVEQNPILNVCVCRNKGARPPLGRGEPSLPAKTPLPASGTVWKRLTCRLAYIKCTLVLHAAVAKQLVSSLNHPPSAPCPLSQEVQCRGAPHAFATAQKTPASRPKLPFSRKHRFKHNQHLRPINRHFYGTPDLWWPRALLSNLQDDTPNTAPEPREEKLSC